MLLYELLTWFLVHNITKQKEDDAKGDKSSPPGEQEHQHHRDNCPKQSSPAAVVFERWPPP